MTALAMMKQGNNQQAGQLFAAIARDQTVPDATRARAVQVASSLGIDAGSAALKQAQ
jgi:D-alanyl-D-alanine carboxypeptidase